MLGLRQAYPAQERPDSIYLASLLQNAHDLKLAQDPYWRILLHYRHHWYANSKSDINSESFFISKGGRTDPDSELSATLRHFLSPSQQTSLKILPFNRRNVSLSIVTSG